MICAAALAQQPRIDGITPARGAIAGGTTVTIRGANFEGVSVTIDRAPVQPLSRADSQMQLRMPAHANGYAVIAVTRGDLSAYARFLYIPPRLEELPAGSITTIAGIGNYGGDYGPATEASFPVAIGMARDAAGRLYFADTGNDRVMRILANGLLEPFAGNGRSSGSRPNGKTPALDVSISFPRSIAFDSRGNLIVPDDGSWIWRIDPNGLAELVAGTGQYATGPTAPENVPALGTAIGQPTSVAVDAADNIYFLDYPGARVRRIDGQGMISTFAGTGTYGFSGDGGPATSAQFSEPFNDLGALAFDHVGNLLLIDAGNHRIRRISAATRSIETIVGPAIDGHTLDNLRGLAVDPNDNVYFSNAAEVYRRSPDGVLTKIASGKNGFSPDGARLPDASLGIVYALFADRPGTLLYSDASFARIRSIDLSTGTISTLAGSGPRVFGEGGEAAAATASISGLSILPSGELVMSWFTGASGLFKIDRDGKLIRTAGGLGPLYDVPALDATIGASSVSVANDGTIDMAGLSVSRIDRDGIVRRTAGRAGEFGFTGDGGSALDALLCQPWDAVRDARGDLFVADTNNNRIRRIRKSDGTIDTVVGSGAVNGFEHYNGGTYCGDGGQATAACINTPYGVAIDDRNRLLVCESGRIRRVEQNGIIGTLASPGCTKLAFAFGNVFTVAGDHIARVSRTGKVTSLTAVGVGFDGDGGPASQAHIWSQLQGGAIVADREGNLFFNDANNVRIRAIRFGAVLAPPDASATAAASGTLLRASIRDGSGNPAEGVRVDFVAPPSGATCLLSSAFAVTDELGEATVSCTPGCVAGSYSVIARPVGSTSTATVAFTNPGHPCRQRAVRH